MNTTILILILFFLAALPAGCSAAGEPESFFNADDVDCPGADMKLGGCWIEFTGTLACKWEEKYIGGPKLQYDIWHFTSNQKARERFRLQAAIVQEQYEIGKKGIPGIRYDLREFTSDDNSIVYETMSQYSGSGSKGTGPARDPPDYSISYAINYHDTLVAHVDFGGYPSEQEFEADKARIKKCITDALERKIPGITSEQAAAGQRAAVQSGEKAAADQNAPFGTGGSSPLSDTLGSAESIVQGGLTPLGGEMLNGLNNLIGDLTGDKPVPPEIEDALAQAGISCNERDPTTRDRCFSSAALESKNPLVCIKMHTGLEQIRKCSEDVIRQSMNPGICENLPAYGQMYGITSGRCFTGFYDSATDERSCNNLSARYRTDCLSVIRERKGTTRPAT